MRKLNSKWSSGRYSICLFPWTGNDLGQLSKWAAERPWRIPRLQIMLQLSEADLTRFSATFAFSSFTRFLWTFSNGKWTQYHPFGSVLAHLYRSYTGSSPNSVCVCVQGSTDTDKMMWYCWNFRKNLIRGIRWVQSRIVWLVGDFWSSRSWGRLTFFTGQHLLFSCSCVLHGCLCVKEEVSLKLMIAGRGAVFL